MQVHQAPLYIQHPYNPNMASSQSQPQYTLQSPSQEAPAEDMFFALERLLMGISPFPPSIPTLAKPTCPALDDNHHLMELAPTSSIPSIVLNEQSLDIHQQYYQALDAQNMEFSDSSTSRSASPPSSPYSYASSSSSSPCMPMEPLVWVPSENKMLWSNDNNSTATIIPSCENNTWNLNLLEQMNMPWPVSDLEHYIAPSTPASAAAAACILNPKSLHQATSSSSRKAKTHRRTSSSSSSSALSAYESTARREHRASSISSVCSSTCSTSSSSRTKSYACPTCTKPFPTRTQLKSHMAIHTDSFPFPCLYAGCDLHFKRKHDLRRHVDAKHALVKKYLCTGGCGEGFGRRDQMVRHLRRGTCGQGFQTE
ncbi:hypothetical protein BG006_003113 [Podila minutissima]|uniref:C2H2-type domain-containing protein n=1 Tax=Podila minutissima TaxID=64525 RepID=A0A9P5SRR7_9FUNG|nr:hypothetical protein BG006_003113 [Podila minutissima]